MALSVTELNAVTDRYFDMTPQDIYFDGAVLLFKLLPRGRKVDGGKTLSKFIKYDRANTGGYGEDTDIPRDKKAIVTRADFRWAGYYASNSIGLADKSQNSGKEAHVNLAVTKIQNVQESIRDKMGEDIYIASTAAAAADQDIVLLGLGDLFQNTDTSIKYGNIAQDDVAKWLANKVAFGGNISFKMMQAMRRLATVNTGKGGIPDLYVAPYILKDGFERTLQTAARHQDGNLVKAGWENILFGLAPLVADPKQADTVVDALNLQYLEMKSHKDYFFTRPVWEHEVGQPDKETMNTRWLGQLCCSNRRAQARYTGVSEPA